ncbi:tetratricopeptide repeat protein [Candidatus Entotheonella palauensis]|uniref:tetratricopeptide repeat protein n=1 Tax=Candidatus Entotheonella palauensis TaxID=93172 RepID=UPI000B7C7AC0|nr:tetratricopeptide repeat protein [Candidatus Entotheonella palauensis]
MRIAFVSIVTTMGTLALIGAMLNRGTDADATVVGFFLIVVLCLVALIVSYLYRPGSEPKLDIGLQGKTGDTTGKAGLSLTPNALGRPEYASVGVAPIITPVRDNQPRIEAVEEVLEQFLSILQEGEETNYAQAADFLERHRSELRKSWKLQVNYGNCLIMLGRYEEAQRVAESVIDCFSGTPQAVARAYGLLVLCASRRMPKVEGRLFAELHEQQLRYVALGLEADPASVALCLNGFEIKCEQNDPCGAVRYLMKAVSINPSEAKLGIQRALRDNDELSSQLQADEQLRELVGLLEVNVDHLSEGGTTA